MDVFAKSRNKICSPDFILLPAFSVYLF